MKKILLLLFLSFTLVSCFSKNENVKDISTQTSSISETSIWTSILEETEEEKEYKIAEKKDRVTISINDIDDALLFPEKVSDKDLEKNPILKNWVSFLRDLKQKEESKVTEKVNWWISYDDYQKAILSTEKKYIREFTLVIDFKDYKTWEKIKTWNLYLNNIKFWEIKDWTFKTDFKWPIWIEKFVLMARVDWYWDWFLNLNSLNSDWSILHWEMYLKKSIEKEVILWEKDLFIWDIDKNNFALKIPACSLVDSKWKCFKWKVKVKSNYISWEDVNEGKVALNMDAITKDWNYIILYSWWMAFNDFIAEDWSILKLWKWKKITVIYKMTEEWMRDFWDLWTEQWDSFYNWYWWYDKNDMIWKEGEAKSFLDIENKHWVSETENLY